MQLFEVGDLIERLIPSATVVRKEENVDRRNYRVSFDKIRKQLHEGALDDKEVSVSTEQSKVPIANIFTSAGEEFDAMLALARAGVDSIVALQAAALAS